MPEYMVRRLSDNSVEFFTATPPFTRSWPGEVGEDYQIVDLTNAQTVTAVDGIVPVAATFSPADNATGVPVNANITITFSEDVQAGTGNFYIYDDGPTLLETVPVGSVTISGTDVTINPTSDFANLANINIQWDAGVVTDTATSPNPVAANADPTLLNFTTAAASAFTAPTHSGNAIFEDPNNVTDAGRTLSVSTGTGGQVLINIVSFGTVAPASVVIGGVTATLDSSDTTVGDRNFFTYIASGVPAGTQDLTITHATGETSNMYVAIYGGGASFVVESAVFNNAFDGDPTANINVAAGDAVYAMSNFAQTTAGTRNADGPQLNVSGTAFDLFHDFFGIGLDINAFSATGLSAATPQTFTISDPNGSTSPQNYGWFVTVTEAP